MTAHRYYDGHYEAHNPGWHEKDAEWKALQIAEFLPRQPPRPRSICDLGCGTGGVLAALRPRMPDTRLLGVEPSPQAASLAREMHPEVPILEGTAADIPERVDLLMALDVFEHVEDYFGFLRSLHGVADRYLFHIPLDMSVSAVARMKPITEGRSKVGHLHYFSRETAIAALAECGFLCVAERYTPVALSAPVTRRRTAVLRLPRQYGARVAPHLTARFLGGFSLLVLAVVAKNKE